MGPGLAILACDGALPVQIAQAYPDALQITLAGVPHQMGAAAREFRIERLGELFDTLRQAGIARLVFAGALTRPALDPGQFDPLMQTIAPRLIGAMGQGDDGLLRQVIAIFEEQGIAVIGAHELLPQLVAGPDLQEGAAADEGDLADAGRACEILRALSPMDIGQSCAVAGGQCLGIETVQGTDALLRFVADTPAALKRGRKGVFVKAAKAQQDLRIDMPTIGPGTIAGVARAGLAGLLIEAGRVMILERDETLRAVSEHGLFLHARPF